MNVSMQLIDAQEMARIHPATFDAPSKDELHAIKLGDYVKICVESVKERFWTRVEWLDGNELVASVDNHLVSLDWPVGTRLRFQRKHVYSIESQA